MMGFGMVIWLVIGVVVVWLIARAVAGVDRPQSRGTPGHDAESILRERFARGDIDQDEYERKLALLRN
jgi:putative membrane protein